MCVKIFRGNTVKLSVPYPYITERCKQMISKDKGVPPHYQQLTFHGQVLEDGHTFEEYNIQYGSTLDLVVRQGSEYIYCVLLWNMLKFTYSQPASNYPDTKRRYFSGDTAFIHYWTYQIYDSRKDRNSYW